MDELQIGGKGRRMAVMVQKPSINYARPCFFLFLYFFIFFSKMTALDFATIETIETAVTATRRMYLSG